MAIAREQLSVFNIMIMKIFIGFLYFIHLLFLFNLFSKKKINKNAEKSGLLCRDETEDGVSFYQNIFDKEFNILMQNRPEWNQN